MQPVIAVRPVAPSLDPLVAVGCARLPSLPAPSPGLFTAVAQMGASGCLARFRGYGWMLLGSSDLVEVMQPPPVGVHQVMRTCSSACFAFHLR